MIYGKHPVLEALKEEVPVEKVMLLQGTHGELEKFLRETCPWNEVRHFPG